MVGAAEQKVFPKGFLLRLPSVWRERIDERVLARRRTSPNFSINDWLLEAVALALEQFELGTPAPIAQADKDWAKSEITKRRKVKPGRVRPVMPAGLPLSEQLRWRREHQ